MEPPKVPTAAQLQADPGIANRKPQLICRLNPPALVATPNGIQIMQAPTQGFMSCWHYREPGTLPGDDRPWDVAPPPSVIA
jgi:hypothetical protein